MNEPARLDRVLRVETPGASIAVHDLGPDASLDDPPDQLAGQLAGQKPGQQAGQHGLAPLLISHATGFHGRCYSPLATELNHRFRAWAIDHRGHGLTSAPPDWSTNWNDYGLDTAIVGRQMAPDGGLVGFGHSMGGATLLLAASLDPTLFRRLVLMEPIVLPPPSPSDEPYDPHQNRLVAAALRRRRAFDSYDAAYDNYRAKPPLSLMEPRVLREYVDGGFRPISADLSDGVELRCTPEFEASVFAAAHTASTWELLPTVQTPTLVVAGRILPNDPSSWAEGIAERLPNGELIVCDDQTHFGPFSHVGDTAVLVAG